MKKKYKLPFWSKVWNMLPKRIRVLLKVYNVKFGLSHLIVTPYMGKYTVSSVSKRIWARDIEIYQYSKSEITDKIWLQYLYDSDMLFYKENVEMFLKYL